MDAQRRLGGRMSSEWSGKRLVNHLRASISHGRGRGALEHVRTVAHPSQYRVLIATAYRVPNRSRYPLLPGFRQKSREILSFTPFRALDLKRELEWAAAILERNESKVVDFLQQLVGMQNCVCNGDDAAALRILAEIQEKYGYSGWAIQSKIALLQITEGQEAQKSYASDIVSENSGLLLGIAHLASQRNEVPVGISGFKYRASETIGSWDVPHAWRTYLRYALLGDIPENEAGAVDLLTTVCSGTCIDLAVTLSDLMAINRSLYESANPAATKRIEGIFAKVNVGNRDVLRGVLAQARSGDGGAPSGGGAIGKVVSCLAAVLNRNFDAAERSDELDKLCTNFGFLPLFRVIGSFSKKLTGEKVPKLSDLKYEASLRLRRPLPFWGGSNPAHSESEAAIDRLEESWKNADFDAATRACEELSGGDSFDFVIAAKARYAIGLACGDWQAAALTAVSCVAKLPGSRYEFSFSEVIDGKSWGELKTSEHPMVTAIAACYAVRELPAGRDAQRLHRHLQQLALQVLRKIKVSHFSELFLDEMTPIQKQFLSDVCTPDVIEVNINLGSSRALFAERMKICQQLVRQDPGAATKYLEEIRQITYTVELEEGIRNFDSSRLFVNEAAIQEWGAKSLAEDYSRYRLLQDASLPELENIQAAAVFVLNDRESPLPQALLDQPKTEADRLLLDLAQRVLREFLYGATSGLNAYLSLRIRHGSLAGHLRGPLEESGAIALRDSTSGVYQSISTWSGIIFHLPTRTGSLINKEFDDFSRRFDERVAYFIEEILQIRSDSKPLGVFDLQVSTVLLNLLKASTSEIEEAYEFVEACTSNFKSALAPAMMKIKTHLQDIKDETGRDVDRLLEHIQSESSDGAISPILDSINRGRTNFNFAADRVSDWFSSIDRAEHERHYSIDQVIRIGENLTRNTRPYFSPDLKIHLIGELPRFAPQFGAFLIADAMFIALDNAYLHSKIDGRISIDVRVELFEGKLLVFDVVNDVSDDAATPQALEKLERIRAQLDSGEYKGMVSGEGGTGLFKLRRLTDRSGGGGDLSFGFDGDRFKVKFGIPIRSIEVEEDQ